MKHTKNITTVPTGNPSELENLRNALTINVTEFYRDNDVYRIS